MDVQRNDARSCKVVEVVYFSKDWMMNKLFLIVAACVVLAACGKSDKEIKALKTPEEIAVAFYEAIADGDQKGALKIVDSELFTSENLANWDKGFEAMEKAFAICGGISKAEAFKITYSNENKRAFVTTKLSFKDGCKDKTDGLRFVHHNDKWVINLNSNPLPMSYGKHIGKY